MILDYRTYCTIYALCGLAHCLSIMLPSRWFFRFVAANAAFAGITGTVNFLDWLWS